MADLRSRQWVGATLFAVVAVAVTVVGTGEPAAADQCLGSGAHRAGVIVEGPSTTRAVCLRFGEDSISGIEALQRAGMDPVVAAFGGLGGAVCALCGEGCPADSSCLSCGGASYWAYFRAPAGSGSFAYSGAGAGAARVRDGDVEGWRWGSGSPPTFRSVAALGGPEDPPPPPPPAAEPPAPGPAPGSPAAGSGAPAPGSVAIPAPGQTAPGATEPSSPTTVGNREGGQDVAADDDEPVSGRAVADATDGDTGGSAWSLVAFAAVLAVLVIGIVAARVARARHRLPPT